MLHGLSKGFVVSRLPQDTLLTGSCNRNIRVAGLVALLVSDDFQDSDGDG